MCMGGKRSVVRGESDEAFMLYFWGEGRMTISGIQSEADRTKDKLWKYLIVVGWWYALMTKVLYLCPTN